MTRLSSELLINIGKELNIYDKELLQKTGYTLRQIASRAVGVTEAEVCDAIDPTLVAVVPITSGKGIIEGFTHAVQSIISYMGFTSFITHNYDVAGLKEGIKRGAKVIFLADDNCFIAINLSYEWIVDNAEATGRGYVSALECLVGGLSNRKVLVIGAGRVGRSATCALKKLGAKIAVFDIDQTRAEILAKEYGTVVERDLKKVLHQYTILVDASPAPEIIDVEHIKSDTAIAACGIPIGLSNEAYSLVRERLVHDPLQIGVATMLVMAVCCR
ncbi:3-methylornithyl-N6-L-lysine dehydrogenase PylD [Candidatus Aerophobetes bacterium]|nr:3-methylornithyl-N6-L-lysine dehydrogenase PylD [Candidatus Aerophobetes bacterium]